ncbi:HET-domain-containing protein [Setomelanomma holmii]|uniref:HET-domain-containing protein n=1 Tax=Setomelanomma holmii TaxID=210430 RepID=A0A9P4LI22_9PLEO|nr:HET-domain-containing protein [Setomelanomma holmii]
MRFLQIDDDSKVSLVDPRFGTNDIRYAILSHTWGPVGDEVTFRDLQQGTGKGKAGFTKIAWCGQQAKKDSLQYFWVDTCCIDKSNSQELQESINSIYRWYQQAESCYVYLSDVCNSTLDDAAGQAAPRWKPAFRRSRWFTRGWTLQELIAPSSVEFFSKDDFYLGNKLSLEITINEVTSVAISALRHQAPLSHFSVDERLSWAKGRVTTREEDSAYCLLGIFDVQMPLVYAEGREKALKQLRREILEQHDDAEAPHTIVEQLDRDKMSTHHGLLWIKGKPGLGKSTLMKFAYVHTRRKLKDSVVVSFFSNARGAELAKSTVGTYRSLLAQLFERDPALQEALDIVSDLVTGSISQNFEWSVEILELLFEEALQRLGETSVICFIDALDECDESLVRDMVRSFEHIGALAVGHNVRFQICFSSRHYPHITINKGLSLALEEHNSRDIFSYIQSELRIGDSHLAQCIRREVQQEASRIFMWIVLVVRILNRDYNGGRIHDPRRKLREIPDDLHDLIRSILVHDLGSHSQKEMELRLQWVLFARYPLRPEELYFAILAGSDSDTVSAWDREEITSSVVKRLILNASKGLTEVTNSPGRIVQFIHESVREFLLKDGLTTIWLELKDNFEGQSHDTLKQCCIRSMDISPVVLQSRERRCTPKDQKSHITRAYPLLEYAVHNVWYHANEAAGYRVDQTCFLDWI